MIYAIEPPQIMPHSLENANGSNEKYALIFRKVKIL